MDIEIIDHAKKIGTHGEPTTGSTKGTIQCAFLVNILSCHALTHEKKTTNHCYCPYESSFLVGQRFANELSIIHWWNEIQTNQ